MTPVGRDQLRSYNAANNYRYSPGYTDHWWITGGWFHRTNGAAYKRDESMVYYFYFMEAPQV